MDIIGGLLWPVDYAYARIARRNFTPLTKYLIGRSYSKKDYNLLSWKERREQAIYQRLAAKSD